MGEQQSSVGRRALLTGGVVTAGGLAAMLAGTPAAGAATPSAGPVTYGPPPSGGDDTSALAAAIAALGTPGGTVLLPPGTYHLSDVLYVPQKVDLRGSGGGYAGIATELLCTTAKAGVYVWGGGGVTGDFVVDGGSVATAPLTRGPEGSSAGRTFAALSVRHSGADGVVCLGAQNDAWYLLTVDTAARDGLVLDRGYGGALFSRCEIATAGRYHLRLDQQVAGGPYSAPSDNVFHQCIFEYTTSGSQSIAYLNGGWANKFDHTSFFASQKPAGPVIEVTGGASEVCFEDVAVQSGSAVGGIGLRVDYGCGVALNGLTHFQYFDTAIYLRKSSGAPSLDPFVDVHGMPLYYNCTNWVGADASVLAPGRTIDYYVCTHADQPVQVRRTKPSDLAWATLVAGTPYYLVSETVDGTRTWGTGASATGDVAFGRRTAGVVGVRATDLLATGYGNTAQRPAASGGATGAIRYNTDTAQLEVCDGTQWHAPASPLVLLPDPVRVYDSRTADGPLHLGDSRTISLAGKVPAAAVGAIVNVTVTSTSGTGYLTLYPAGGTRPDTSSVNWYASGQTLANQATTALGSNAQLAAYCGGKSAQFIIDVLAYLT